MIKHRPGGELAVRPVHFFFLLDTSGSMSVGGKIQSLNRAVREAIPHMRKVASENSNSRILVRVVTFDSTARWHTAIQTPIENFTFKDVSAGGSTEMGAALRLVAEQLRMPPMERRAFPPVLLLISDGRPTDDFDTALSELLSLPWGKMSVRTAIGIGRDADYRILSKFISDPEIPVLEASNPEQLVRFIRFNSVTALMSASSPATRVVSGIAEGNTTPVVQTFDVDEPIVW